MMGAAVGDTERSSAAAMRRSRRWHRRRSGRARRGTPVLLLLLVAFLVPAAPALATGPSLPLDSGRVTDQAGVLSATERSSADAELSELSKSADVDLFVVLVDQFTDPADSQQWADEVAKRNGFGKNQYLLAISTEGRQFYLSADNQGPLSPQQLDEVEAKAKPLLSKNDYAGAISAASGQVASALEGGSVGGFGGVIAVLILLAVAGLAIWWIVRRRRVSAGTRGGAAPDPGPTTEELRRTAATALVRTDDAIKTSAQELDFATAQFGDAATAVFAQTVTDAKAKLDQAFALKQLLDDEIPDTEEQQRQWYAQIAELCTAANSALDETSAAFDELRELEASAPEALERLRGGREAVAAELDAADERLGGLRQRYAATALATVADNVEQGRSRLTFADEQIVRAQETLTAGDRSAAAVSIRAAEEATAQVRLLAGAVERLATDLAAAESGSESLIGELESDLVAAGGLPDADGRIAAATRTVRERIAAARSDAAAPQRDPISAIGALETANEMIDGLIAEVRDTQLREQRAREALGQTLQQAQTKISAVGDFITARRGAIGVTARTRHAEAGSALQQALQLQTTDPASALQWAQRANQLADEAARTAQEDLSAYSSPQSVGGGGSLNGALLGGILIDSLLRGGGGGFGGGSRGSGGGGGGFSGGR